MILQEKRQMTAHFETLRHEDEKKAMAFAITGMHFDHYMESPFLQRLYARYFWYLESGKATQNIAMYGDTSMCQPLTSSRNISSKVRIPTMMRILRCLRHTQRCISWMEKSYSLRRILRLR